LKKVQAIKGINKDQHSSQVVGIDNAAETPKDLDKKPAQTSGSKSKEISET